MRVLPRRNDAAHRIRFRMIEQNADGIIHAGQRADRRCRAQLNDDVGVIIFVLCQPFERVLIDGQIGGIVFRKNGRAHKGRFRAVFTRHFGDLGVVRADDHARDKFGFQASRDAVRDQRVARKIADVLARNALRAAARGDNSQYLSHLYSVSSFQYSVLGIQQPGFGLYCLLTTDN